MKSSLENTIFTLNGKKISNYKFLDSKEERLIQISDVWVGLMGRLFFMLDQSSPDIIKSKMESLNETQKECIHIINSLIDRSERLHIALIQNVNSLEMVQHRGALLELMDELVR